MRAALDAQGDMPDSKVSLVVIGEKGESAFSDMGRVFRSFPGINQETIYEQAVDIKDYIVRETLGGRMGKVILAYPKPISFSAQEIAVISILPCGELFRREPAAGMADAAGIFARARGVIIESSFEDMVSYLAGTWVTSKLYEVFEDSKLAEFSARAMHLEGSFQKLEEQLKKVRHRVFKATHEKIDKGMRESFGAKKGLKVRQRSAAAPATASG
jgi:F0F1-type ATP synthase gamma subunit